MGVKFGMEEGTFGPLLHAKFHPHRFNVSPLRGEKPQNLPLSKLNTGRFALRAMLPVTRDIDVLPNINSKQPAEINHGSDGMVLSALMQNDAILAASAFHFVAAEGMMGAHSSFLCL